MENNIFEKDVEVFGKDSQLDKAKEELSELLTELLKYSSGKTSFEKIEDEIADVKIMVEQLEIIFNKGRIAERYEFKLNRLSERINNRKTK